MRQALGRERLSRGPSGATRVPADPADAAGRPPRHAGGICHGQTSPFLVDPVTYGGRAVFVNARADSSASSLWGYPGVDFTVAPAKPAVSVAADNWHVTAVLPGTSRFTFVVKVAG